MSRVEDPLKLRIVEAALELSEHAGTVSSSELLERFPGCEEAVEAALRALGIYETRVARDRRRARSSVADVLLEPGAIVGDFEIEHVIGRGTMGVVYRARQRSLGARAVALKVLPPALVARDPRFLERFRREAALASEVHDAHLAEVYGFGEQDGLVFFAMRLIEGRTLADVLNSLVLRRRLGERKHISAEYVVRVVRLLREIAMAAKALHERGLVHRDIKPSNIILEDSGKDDLDALTRPPVLVDFGLLKPVRDSELTGSQTLLGTPAYASPEAKLGREVGTRADVFALGATLHELLTLTAAGAREAAAGGQHSTAGLNPAVDERLDAIVGMALDERAELRYEDGGALLIELEHYLHSEPLRAHPETAVGRARLWSRRHPERAARLVATCGLATTLLGIAAFVLGAFVYPVLRAADRAGEFEATGDLRAAREEWAQVFHSSWSHMLPLAAGGRDQAAKYWAKSGFLSAPLAALARDEVGAGQLGLQRAYFQSDSGEDRDLILDFLAYELAQLGRPNRRLQAAESAAKLLLRPGTGFEVNGPADSAQKRLLDALLAVSREADQTHSPEAPLLRQVVSALGGTGSVEAFRAVQPFLVTPDNELQRVATVASVRLWWSLRGSPKQQTPDGREFYAGLLKFDQSLWVDWATNLWASMQRHTPRTGSGGGLGAYYESLVVEAVGSAAGCLAWTRMDLSAAGQLDAAAWQKLPAEWLAYLIARQANLTAVRDGHPPEPTTGADAPLPNRGKRSTWSYAFRFPETEFKERASPTSPYQYPLPPATKSTTSTATHAPDFGARLASVAFRAGARPESQVALTGAAIRFTWHGTIEKPLGFHSLSLRGLEDRAELICQARPEDGQIARIRLTYDCPAVFPLPHSGGARMRISINAGELITERFCYMSSETLEVLVPEMVLAMRPDLKIEIDMQSESILWIHGIEVTYE